MPYTRLRAVAGSVLLALNLLSAAPAVAASDPLADPAVAEAFAKLDVWLDGQRRALDLPGFSVGVVHEDRLLWSKGYGYADLARRVPATDRTLYRVASISKTFTATAVVQLAERGKLSLQDPVAKHLPWFQPAPAEDAADGDAPVRVWNLLSHTAGLQREPPGADWDALLAPSLEQVVKRTPDTAASLPAASRLKYSNYGYYVAGQLVERLGGKPYVAYVEQELLRPLGMQDSRFAGGDVEPPGLAVPYGRRPPAGGPRRIEAQLERSDEFLCVGGLVSSVRDLARWASFQLGASSAPVREVAVLGAESRRTMQRPQFLLEDWGQGWGLGWRLTRHEGGARIDHGGSLPGYKSSLLIDPASRLAVVVLFNADDGPRQFSTQILDLLAPSLQAVLRPVEAKPSTPSAELARFAGRYEDRSGSPVHVLVAADGRLRLLDPEADDIAASSIPLRQTGTTRFVTEAPVRALTSNVASVIDFELAADGRVQSLTAESGAYRFRRVD